MTRITHAITPLAVAISTILSYPVIAQTDSESHSDTRIDEQMVITATHTEVSTTKAPASISVITEEDILSEPGLALNDLVKNIAGVESQMDGGRAGREMISIRGMDAGFTMILVNGRKLSSSNAVFRGNDFDLAAVPKESIQRIEIIRGPMSALYGSEALGGVINVITKKPTNEWQSQVSGDYGYRDDDGGSEYTAGFNTSGALLEDELFLSLSMNKSSRDPWHAFSGQGVSDNGNVYDRSQATTLEQRDTLTASGSLQWYINNEHDLAFDFSYADDQRDGVIESTNGLTDSESKVVRNTQALTYNGTYDWGDALLRYNRDASETKDNFNDRNADLGLYDVNEVNHTVDGHGTTVVGNHTLTFGGEWKYTELKNPDSLTQTGKATVNQQALFIQDQWALSQKNTLTYGTRVDMHESFGTHWSPRAYLVHSATDQWTIKGGVGTAFKAPSLTQLSSENIVNSCKGNCLLVGNPDLQPETSLNYELSTSYVDTYWSMEAGLFRNEVSNLIDRDLDNPVDNVGGRDVYTYKNIDEAIIQGAEFSGEYDILANLRLNGTYTYLTTEDKTTGEELENRPNHMAMARLVWEPVDSISTFARVNYTSRTLLSVDDNVYRPSYVTADLGMNYFVNNDWRLRAGVKNVTNEQFDDYDVTRRGYVVTPRNWYVGTTLNF
ncbi:TonB-dependent receptor [Vibrio sp. La 4.2.2]|uniref:TonB-dependent receptor domain-containing protein n=1 Tax=Vibrio sp. La 4.2.2 TaxID=2998830 RepID=UPI0022CE22FF|nr:TonB-dependent receptor [Vibrio sp. La 4.2.2]MDA0106943.1 TonB-dependent receptor [Vibrio sp. La 4.2.2]